MSDARYRPATLFYVMDGSDWRMLHEALNLLPQAANARVLVQRALDAIQARSEDRFGMLVWCVDDALGVAARLLGRESPGEPATFESAGLTRAQVEEVMGNAETAMINAQTEAGWDALDYVVGEFLREEGLLTD